MKTFDKIIQQTDEWFQKRKGKVTGTVLKDIMGTPYKRQEAIYEMIGDILAEGVEDPSENAMARGNRLEGEARVMFEFEMSKKVSETGIAESENNRQIANSPDGLIGENEALEIKCMGRKNHVKMWLTNSIPDDYEWQVVQYFIVNSKLEKLFFVGYHPEIKIHPMHIIIVKREEVLAKILSAEKAQQAFLMEVKSILSTIIKF